MARTFTTEVLGRTYTYRGATRGEFEQAQRESETAAEVEDFLVGRCVLNPRGIPWQDQRAGIASRIGKAIADASGLTDEAREELEREALEWSRTPAGRSEILMMGLLHLKLDEIDQLDPIDWFKCAVAAETLYTTALKAQTPEPGPPGPPGMPGRPGQPAPAQAVGPPAVRGRPQPEMVPELVQVFQR
jgi:hypothetical protein